MAYSWHIVTIMGLHGIQLYDFVSRFWFSVDICNHLPWSPEQWMCFNIVCCFWCCRCLFWCAEQLDMAVQQWLRGPVLQPRSPSPSPHSPPAGHSPTQSALSEVWWVFNMHWYASAVWTCCLAAFWLCWCLVMDQWHQATRKVNLALVCMLLLF